MRPTDRMVVRLALNRGGGLLGIAVASAHSPLLLRQSDHSPTMKTLFRIVTALVFGITVSAQAAETVRAVEKSSIIDAVTAADDERTAAMKAGGSARLDAILSNELRYAHSNGAVDNKAALIASLVSRKSVYENFEYKDRTILPASPGIAVMSGRVLVKVVSGGQNLALDLNYLSVWREENGKWRFLAWQSCRNPVPAPVPAPAPTK
jgi:hypothetical protein